jgi:hypothetical protein
MRPSADRERASDDARYRRPRPGPATSRLRFNQTREATTTDFSLRDELFTGRTNTTGKIRHVTRADNAAEAEDRRDHLIGGEIGFGYAVLAFRTGCRVRRRPGSGGTSESVKK